MALRIIIETIPHDQQRYPTVGDWWWDPDGTTHIAVSDMGDWRKEACVAVHELVEVLICRHTGVSQADVDAFDTNYETLRSNEGYPSLISEPGDDPTSPYRMEHCVATGVERILCAMLGLSWKQYEDKINAL